MLQKSLLFISIFSFLSLPIFANERKVGVQDVRIMLKEGQLTSSETCLDEYIKRRNHLWISMGLGLPAAPLDVIGGGFVGAGAGYLVEVATGAALVGIVEPVLLGVYFGWLGGAALAVAWEIGAIVKLVQNGFLIKVIAESRNGQGKNLEKFLRKYLHKYKKDRGLIDDKRLASMIKEADTSGLLCDGSLTKKGHKKSLRHKLALKKDIFKYIHNKLH